MNENQLEEILNTYKDIHPSELTREKWRSQMLEEKHRSLQIKKRMWLLGLSTSLMGLAVGVLLMLPLSKNTNVNENIQESGIEYIIYH